MVKAQQVNEAVDKQALQLARERMSRLPRLFFCLGNGNDYVPQKMGLDGRERPFPQGERKHIRGPVLAAPCAVEREHGPVADEENAQFGIRKTGAP